MLNRKIVTIAAVGTVLPFLVFLEGVFFIPPLVGLMLWPGDRAVTMLGISEGAAGFVVAIVLAWVLWAAVFAAMIGAIKQFLWPHRKLFLVCTIVIVAALFFEARGTHNKEYDGTWELGDERSAFYLGGECWRPPYWLEPTSDLSGLEALGHSSAVRIKFIGDTSWIGHYGHLGGYMREIRVVRVIDVQAVKRCRP